MSRRRPLTWAISVLVLVLVLVGMPAPTTRAQATPAATPLLQYTPLLPSVLSPPRWFAGSDGHVHLVYELLVTNAFPVPVTVGTVEVLDAESGASVASLRGEALTAAMSLLSTPSTATTTLPPSTIGLVWWDIAMPDPNALPATITHRIAATLPPGLPVPPQVSFTGATVAVDRRPPVVLGPPLLGPRWVALGSCCDGPHRRALQPLDGRLYLSQRFAIDFNVLNAAGRLASGDLTRNESNASYGQTVIAVADATVVSAVDRWPDQVPNPRAT